MRSSGRSPSDLYRRLWAVAARIPRGRVATYGQIAALAGRPGQPRLAGYAMRHLPEGSGIPWHRVVNASGRISLRSGFFSGAEESLQAALLRREGIRFDGQGRIDLASYRWRPRTVRFTLPKTRGTVRESGRNTP